MATAAEKKIIIEQGSDFVIEVQVYDDVTPKVLDAGASVSLTLKHIDNTGAIVTDDTYPGTIVDAGTGQVEVTIDKLVTVALPTGINDATFPATTETLSPFNTEYNYFYTIDLVNLAEDLRLLRGRCAVRL